MEKTTNYDSDNSTKSITSESSDDDYRKHRWRHDQQKKIKDNNIKNDLYDTIGIITELNKYTPFINYMIEKRKKSCMFGASTHIAALIPTSYTCSIQLNSFGFGRIIYGENSEKPLHSNNIIGTHAEMDALKRVFPLLRNGKIKKNKMNLIVLRINKLGELRESAPCFHCTKELAKKENIIINKLYFSRTDGTIICFKFDDWVKLGTSHISKGWRQMRLQ